MPRVLLLLAFGCLVPVGCNAILGNGSGEFEASSGESAGSGQFLLFSAEEELALEKLRAVDIDQMTPISALGLLATLQDRLKRR